MMSLTARVVSPARVGAARATPRTAARASPKCRASHSAGVLDERESDQHQGRTGISRGHIKLAAFAPFKEKASTARAAADLEIEARPGPEHPGERTRREQEAREAGAVQALAPAVSVQPATVTTATVPTATVPTATVPTATVPTGATAGGPITDALSGETPLRAPRRVAGTEKCRQAGAVSPGAAPRFKLTTAQRPRTSGREHGKAQGQAKSPPGMYNR